MMNSSSRKKFEIGDNREKSAKNYKSKQTTLLEVDEEEHENERQYSSSSENKKDKL